MNQRVTRARFLHSGTVKRIPVKRWRTDNELTVKHLTLLPLLFSLAFVKGVSSIGCFVCSSTNNSDPSCDDNFNTSSELISEDDQLSQSVKIKYYQNPCFGYKKDRQGLFPADHCIKIAGERDNAPVLVSGDKVEKITIRTCALDSGSLTADTELVRISHCGHFYYNDVNYAGCVQSCNSEGCNGAPPQAQLFRGIHLLLMVCMITLSLYASEVI